MGFKTITFTLNGRERTCSVDVRMSLTELLREEFGLTSVKTGCEVGECGACCVLVDGRAYNSCIYLAVWVDGKSVLTVEGLRGPATGQLHPIQQAFVDEAAVQCGFCTPGIIMTAVELIGTGKTYTREQLRRAISGHLCRCTGYENILNALEKLVREKRDS
ncbi:MAG: (2Fe-2S)-binding protein [Oscillospiraceae bacterium]|nr:(2Fe-2S)-binding protein [Oscillospiraceae bacterium]